MTNLQKLTSIEVESEEEYRFGKSPLALMPIIDGNSFVLLTYLINRYNIEKKNIITSISYLSNALVIDTKTTQKCIKTLINLDIISKQSGNGSMNSYIINFKTIKKYDSMSTLELIKLGQELKQSKKESSLSNKKNKLNNTIKKEKELVTEPENESNDIQEPTEQITNQKENEIMVTKEEIEESKEKLTINEYQLGNILSDNGIDKSMIKLVMLFKLNARMMKDEINQYNNNIDKYNSIVSQYKIIN